MSCNPQQDEDRLGQDVVAGLLPSLLQHLEQANISPSSSSLLLPPRTCLCPCSATLVVCAVSLVGQWMAEAQSKLGGSLRIHMYHGQSRIRSPEVLATKFDLVSHAGEGVYVTGRRGYKFGM